MWVKYDKVIPLKTPERRGAEATLLSGSSKQVSNSRGVSHLFPQVWP